MSKEPHNDQVVEKEEPIDPELPIFDAHHHLWRRPGEDYSIETFLTDIRSSGHNVTGSAFVEGGSFTLLPDGQEQAEAEVRKAASAARYSATQTHGAIRACSVIVGHVDLRLGDAVRPLLARLDDACGGRLRAIRHCGTWDASEDVRGGAPIAPPGLYADPDFRKGLSVVQHYGLVFDCWAYQTQHDEVLDLARAFPDLPIVYNHVGGVLGTGPYDGRRGELYTRWFQGMTWLAALPNLYMKLGGLGMKRSGFAFHGRADRPSGTELAQAWRPWIEPSIELFGPSRCIVDCC